MNILEEYFRSSFVIWGQIGNKNPDTTDYIVRFHLYEMTKTGKSIERLIIFQWQGGRGHKV